MIGSDGSESAPLGSVLARWDALIVHWNLDEAELSALLGGFRGGAVGSVDTYGHERAEERMRLLVDLGVLLDRVHTNQRRTRSWLRAPNRHLGGSTPIETMASSTAWMRWLVEHAGLTS